MRFYKQTFYTMLIAVACSKTNGKQEEKINGALEGIVMVTLGSCNQTTLSQSPVNICLDSVQDSRCPKGTLCFWKGTVFAKISMTINNQTHRFYLGLDKGFPGRPKDTAIQNFNISLLNIFPYPGDSAWVKPYAEVYIQ